MKKKGFTVLISENKEGYCAFDELILKVANTIEEAEDIVLNTINPMINGKYEDLEDLDNYLETLDNEQGYAPRFEIQEFELGEDEEQDTVFVASKEEKEELIIKLPCKEGTEVYCIGGCGEICDDWDIDCGFCIDHDIVFTTKFDRNMVEQFGDTVFLSKENAEVQLISKKLAELNEKVGTPDLDECKAIFIKYYLSLLPKEYQHLDFGLHTKKFCIVDTKGARVI